MKKYLVILSVVFFQCSSALGQERYLSGVLTDNGEPILFGTVAIYRNGILIRGVETDLDGKYKILCKAGDMVEFSYIGYKPRRVMVTESMLGAEVYVEKIEVKPIINPTLKKQFENRRFKVPATTNEPLLKVKGSFYYARDVIKNGKTVNFLPVEQIRYHSIDVEQRIAFQYVQKNNLHPTNQVYSQGQSVNASAQYQPGETDFSWGPSINELGLIGFNNNLLSGSIAHRTKVILKSLKGNIAWMTSLGVERGSDIFNFHRQNQWSLKTGLKKQSTSVVHDLTFSFNRKTIEAHNFGGYYQRLLRSMLTTSPSHDLSSNESFNQNRPSYKGILAENNPLRTTSMSLNYKGRQNLYGRNQIILEYFTNLGWSTYDLQERNESFHIDNQNIKTGFKLFKYLFNDYQKRIQLNNKLDYQRYNIDNNETTSNSRNEEISLLRYRPSVSLVLGGYRNSLVLKNDILLTNNQKSEWFLPTLKFVKQKNFRKKYLSKVELTLDYNRDVRLMDAIFSSTKLSAQNDTHFRSFDSQFDYLLLNDLDLINETNHRLSSALIFTNSWKRNNIKVGMDYLFNRRNNIILPTQMEGGNFALKNLANVNVHELNLSLTANLKTRNYKYVQQSNIVLGTNNVAKTKGDNDILLSGFNTISLQLLENEPVGIIVGTDYKRNDNGELIIDHEGFPIAETSHSIIGNPLPLFRFNHSQSLSKGNWSLDISFNGQVGGEVWDGTSLDLDYLGGSKLTEEQRELSKVFPGVLEDGRTNTQEVRLYDPSTNTNFWTRYGRDGVGAAYIKDASHIRLRELKLTYQNTQYQNERGFRLSFYAKNILTISGFQGFTINDIFDDQRYSGLQYFNQPITSELGVEFRLFL